MTDADRIIELQRAKGLTWKELAAKTGLTSPQAFVDIRSGRHGISKGLAAKIIAAFPEIRQEWLMLGTGPMTKDEEDNLIPIYNTARDTTVSASARISAGSCFPRAEMAMWNTSDCMKEYPVGSLLILKRVNDRKLLVPGSDYVVETNDFCIVRRLQKGPDERHISLYATCPDTYPDGKPVHEPFSVPLEAVTRIYAVMGYIFTVSNEIAPAK